MLFFLSLTLRAYETKGQTTYESFKSKYKPHQEKLDQRNESVQIIEYLSGAELAAVLDNYVKEGDKKMFSLLLCSVNRTFAAEALGLMPTASAIKGLNWLEKHYSLDILWFLDQETFNRIAPSVASYNSYLNR